MAHGNLWIYNMEMCCSMQVSSLRAKLKMYKDIGNTTSCTVNPDAPAAPYEDYLFDCMNLYARLDENGAVELIGTVFYWNPVDGDSKKSATIQEFPDIDACIEWLEDENIACKKCVDIMDDNC